jgi:hypothetical protein
VNVCSIFSEKVILREAWLDSGDDVREETGGDVHSDAEGSGGAAIKKSRSEGFLGEQVGRRARVVVVRVLGHCDMSVYGVWRVVAMKGGQDPKGTYLPRRLTGN